MRRGGAWSRRDSCRCGRGERSAERCGDCFYLIWEGWPDVASLCTGLGAAKVDLAGDRGSVVR